MKFEGVINVIGSVSYGKPKSIPSILDCWVNTCTARGVAVGSRAMMEDMVAAIEANNIHPVVDDKSFLLDKAKDAFHYFVSLSSH
jgi:D-arabinose 1-dehydrogenase-like Zn-dependent alcohol dehydrogenase